MSPDSQKRIWAQAQNFLRNGRRRQAPRRRHGPNGPCLSDGALPPSIGAEGGICKERQRRDGIAIAARSADRVTLFRQPDFEARRPVAACVRLFVCKTRGPAPRKQKARRHCGAFCLQNAGPCPAQTKSPPPLRQRTITIYIINTFLSPDSQKRIWAQAQNFLRNGRRRQAQRPRHGSNGPCLSDGALPPSIGAEGGI